MYKAIVQEVLQDHSTWWATAFFIQYQMVELMVLVIAHNREEQILRDKKRAEHEYNQC